MSGAGAAGPKLTLGPILFNWPAERKRDFYLRIADEAPVDVVYVGEVVCSKRSPYFDGHMPEIVDRLTRAGKQVVLSTLALVMSDREVDTLRALTTADEALVEANDLAAVRLLSGRPHVVGPFVNVDNEGTLGYLAHNGAMRVVLSNELSAPAIAVLAAARSHVELEVQVFGRLPRAISARCYHARSRGLHKDSCQYVCAEDDDGMALETLDGAPFLSVNGTQTLSHSVCSLVRELGTLRNMGIDNLRIWPHSSDMVAVAELFRSVLDGGTESGAAEERLAELVPFATFANGYFRECEGAASTHAVDTLRPVL